MGVGTTSASTCRFSPGWAKIHVLSLPLYLCLSLSLPPSVPPARCCTLAIRYKGYSMEYVCPYLESNVPSTNMLYGSTG